MMSIKEIKEKLSVLKENRDIHKVILFGSYARGDITRKSDETEFSRVSHRPFIKNIIKEGIVVYES